MFPLCLGARSQTREFNKALGVSQVPPAEGDLTLRIRARRRCSTSHVALKIWTTSASVASEVVAGRVLYDKRGSPAELTTTQKRERVNAAPDPQPANGKE